MATLTPRLNLNKFTFGETGWVDLNNANWDTLDASPLGHLKAEAQSTPGMTLAIGSGIVYTGTAPIYYAGGNTGTFTAPSTNPRIDQVSMNSSGVLVITQGAEAASPTPPAYPAANIPICEVFLRVGSTAIHNTDQGSHGYILRDVRPFVRLGAGSGSGVTGIHKTGQSDIVGSVEAAQGSGIGIAQAGQVLTWSNTGVVNLDILGSPGLTGAVRIDVRDGVGMERDTGTNAIRLFSTLPTPMTNPMTTLGDLIRGGVGGAPTRLAAPADGDYFWRFTGGVPAYAQLPTGRRSATRIVAANNATLTSKNGADHVCDGVDDEVELAVAIAAVTTTGGEIWLSEGTFFVSAATAGQSNITLRGAGPGATIIKIKNSLNATMDVFTLGSSVVNFCLRDLTIDGNDANNTGTQRGIVTAVNMSRLLLHNVEVKNFSGRGIYLESGNFNHSLSQVYITLCSDGLYLNGCDSSSFHNVISEINGSRGIVLANGSNDNRFVQCRCYSNTLQGMYITGTSDRNVIGAGCLFDLNQRQGILIDSGSYNAIVANTFHSNGREFNNQYANVRIEGISNYNTVVANNFYRGSGGLQSKFAIEIASGASTPIGSKIYPNMTAQGGATRDIYNAGVSTDLGPDPYIVIPPQSTGWTQLLQSGAIAFDSDAYVGIKAPRTSADAISMLVRSLPATPYKIAINLEGLWVAANQNSFGLLWRNSSSGNLILARFNYNNGIIFNAPRYSSPTTFVSSASDKVLTQTYQWMRLRDDGTTRYVDLATIGKTDLVNDDAYWVTVHSEARTTYITPDQYGFFVNPFQPSTPYWDLQVVLKSLYVYS